MTSSRDRLEAALARIADPDGEGARACLTVYTQAARDAADAADARAKAGISLGPLDGAIVGIKDLFDVAGEVTRAGSKVLAEEGKPAAADAPVVRRLRAGGAVIVAKTNMSEFAYSGIGANPHYGTPGNPADRKRVPGGSSSGAAVAAADGMCEVAIGTDTGGSTRIPAAFCGIVGFKPSRERIPTDGAFPLSYSIDSIGPLAKSVEACAKADAVMAGDELGAVRARAACQSAGRYRAGPGAGTSRCDCRQELPARDRHAGKSRIPVVQRETAAARRYGAGERKRRRAAGGSLRHPPRSARPPRRRHRPERARPARARAQHRRRGFHRHGTGARRS